MTRFCFIANYHLTPLQIAVATGLQSRGIHSCWIVVNRRRRDEILEAGWSKADVLYLPLPVSKEYRQFDKYPIKFFDLITADRALRHMPARALAFLHNSAESMLEFLQRQHIDFVFGEPTWAHERLAAALCDRLGNVKFLWPHTVRFPSGRWGFFIGEDQTQLFELSECKDGDTVALQSLDTSTPSYVKRNNELLAHAQSPLARLSRIKRFLTRENIDTKDPTLIQSRMATLKVAGGEELNRVLYRFVKRTPISDELLGRPFVLYALHKQPESSIDVIGRYYEDQAKLIEALWRSLPTGWWLYVKEHTNAIGDRPPAFYHRVQKLLNVEILDERASAKQVIAASQAVFTVSGTIAYEAALLGKLSFTFAPMFFNRFPRCSRISIDDLRNSVDLKDLVAKLGLEHASDASLFVLKNSISGSFTDVYSDPAVVSSINVKQVVDGFMRIVKCVA